VNPKAVQNSDDHLWSFAMLPDVDQVSTIPSPFAFLISVFGLTATVWWQGVGVNAPMSDPLMPRSQASNRVGQRRERDRAARVKERRIRR
jgi:hypothetical protein